MISASRCSLVECLISWPHLHSSFPAQPKERTHFRTEQVSPWLEGQSGPATPPGAQPSPPGRTASPRMMPTSRRSRTASRSFTCFPSSLNSQNLNAEHQYDMTDINILSRLWDKLIFFQVVSSTWDDVDCANTMPAYACQRPPAWLESKYMYKYTKIQYLHMLNDSTSEGLYL